MFRDLRYRDVEIKYIDIQVGDGGHDGIGGGDAGGDGSDESGDGDGRGGDNNEDETDDDDDDNGIIDGKYGDGYLKENL